MPLYFHKDLDLSAGVLELDHPSWSVLVTKLTERFLTASDVKILTGITYRQINDWEARGYIISQRESLEEWRRFSILQLLGMALLKEVKRHGIPLSRVQKIVDFTRVRHVLVERIPEFIKGYDYWLWTDFSKHLWVSVNPPPRLAPHPSLKIKREARGFEHSEIVVGIPVKKIIDRVIKKFDFEDFKVNINPDGGYSFTINQVPLTLEKEMPLEDPNLTHTYLLEGAVKPSLIRLMKRKRKK